MNVFRILISTHFPANTDLYTITLLLSHTDYKLALWATLVFFVYGSSLQGSAGLLMCLARLVLHSHLEPYRDPVDNLFDCKFASSNLHINLRYDTLFGGSIHS